MPPWKIGRDIRTDAPEAGARLEQLIHRQRGTAGIGAQHDIGQAVGDGDADLCAGRMHVGFGLEHVRALRHQRRRQAYRQLLRQLQFGEIEGCIRGLARELAHQHSEQVALLRQLLEQRR